MSQNSVLNVSNVVKNKKPMNPLVKNQLIGGICAALIVIFACIRIFVLHASVDGIFMNLMTITGTVLSLVVLTSAVRIMLAAKKMKTFENVLIDGCAEIDRRYGALIVEKVDGKDGEKDRRRASGKDKRKAGEENRRESGEKDRRYAGRRTGNRASSIDGVTYLIADNVDTIFTYQPEEWRGNVRYLEKFTFSDNFYQTRTIFYYVNYINMTGRAERLGEDPETVARILARDTAVAIQRSFADILTAHALEVTQEKGRAVVTILINSTETPKDAERIVELIDYLLFLHFVAT